MANDNVKIVVDLPGHWAGVGGEGIWARQVGPDLYEIDNIPFHAYGLSMGDIVRAVPRTPTQKPLLTNVVESRGHRTLRAVFQGSLERGQQDQHLESLRVLGARTEWATTRLVAIDVPPSADYEAIVSVLAAHSTDGLLDYETCEERIPGSFTSGSDDE